MMWLNEVEDLVDLLDFRTGKGKPGPIDPTLRDVVARFRVLLATTDTGPPWYCRTCGCPADHTTERHGP